MHYQRSRLTGTTKSLKKSDRVRFLESTKITHSCIEWTGNLNAFGYGRFGYESVRVMAHRYSYELFVGPIPNGNVIHNMCKNRKCVNPSHLASVIQAENLAEAQHTKEVYKESVVSAVFAASFYAATLPELVR